MRQRSHMLAEMGVRLIVEFPYVNTVFLSRSNSFIPMQEPAWMVPDKRIVGIWHLFWHKPRSLAHLSLLSALPGSFHADPVSVDQAILDIGLAQGACQYQDQSEYGAG